MKSIFANIVMILSFLPFQTLFSYSVKGEDREISSVPTKNQEQLPNYGVISWVAYGTETELHSLGFTPEEGYINLRNMFSSQLGVLPSKIQIMAASGAVIADDATLQHYVRWCIEQNTPMMFVVRVK